MVVCIRSSMAVPSLPSSFLFVFLLLLCTLLSVCKVSSSTVTSVEEEEPESFIVFMSKSKKPRAFSTHHDWYSSIVHTLSPLSNHSESSELVYTYERVGHGFSARLTPFQASELRNVPGVISVLPDHLHQLQTTLSPQFLGLSDSDLSGLWRSTDYGADTIVGVLDTGIWPDNRRSFSDAGLSPPPSRWKGRCQVTQDFPATLCNNKIIGARFFYSGYQAATRTRTRKQQRIDDGVLQETASPRDNYGHGTHVASTAAGTMVWDANFLEYAKGDAKGIALKAKIAVYKVCWFQSCADSDILAGMEEAIKDGVDVLSLSLGGPDGGATGRARDYRQDPLTIGAFHAVKQGVNVVCAAGNYGPNPGTARNIAPWILTVGASTINREFPAVVILGNNLKFTGTSLYSPAPSSTNPAPVVFGGYCAPGKLKALKDVTGKIVFCEQGDGVSIVDKGIVVAKYGGVGMIVPNLPSQGYQLQANADMIPTSVVTEPDGKVIKNYVTSTSSPTARFEFQGTVIGATPYAPRVAAFSGRGPNIVTPEILKPDVIAPGLNILAAYAGAQGPSGSSADDRRTEFNIMSGTSMACPHVSGLAAMLKKLHPSWSPAAIRSALMTTAYAKDNSIIDLSTGQISKPYIHGSGHVDPTKATDPGLVYDTGSDDYVDFLCTIGYDSNTIEVFEGGPVDCSNRNLGNPGSLNYPSFSVVFKNNLQTVKYKRTVKNVGTNKNVVYTGQGELDPPDAVDVKVSLEKLEFSEGNDIITYDVTFTSRKPYAKGAYGSLVWSYGTYRVSSPIAVMWEEGALQSEL